MSWLILGLVLFFVPHSLGIFAHGWRNRMSDRLGDGLWKGLFAVVTAIGFGMIIYGFGDYRPQASDWYQAPSGMRHLAYALMPVALIATFAAFFDGWLRKILKHPLLVAIKLWALVHLLNNGDTASLMLFGSFLCWAVLMRISLKRRDGGRRAMVLSIGVWGDWIAVLLALIMSYWLKFGTLVP